MVEEVNLFVEDTQMTHLDHTPLTIGNMSPFVENAAQTNFDESLNYSQDTITIGGNSTIGAMSGGRSTFGRFQNNLASYMQQSADRTNDLNYSDSVDFNLTQVNNTVKS